MFIAKLRGLDLLMSVHFGMWNISFVLVCSVWIFVCLAPAANSRDCGGPHWVSRKIVRHMHQYDVKILYPALSGLPNSEALNRRLKQLLLAQIRNYRNQLGGMDQAAVRGYINGDYKVKVATSKVLSIRFHFETYSPDAAHSVDTTLGFNYCPKSGQKIVLKNLFYSEINYPDALSVKLVSSLLTQTQGADISWMLKGKSLEAKSFENFTLSRQGFQFYFNEYQLAPYALGDLCVDVPYSEVWDLLSPKSPIGGFTSNHQPPVDDISSLTRKDLQIRLAVAAIAQYSLAIVNNPADFRAFLGRAFWYKKLGRDTAAETDLKCAESLGAPRDQ
jgi:Protein of unknown function (DUF3298)